MNFHFHFHIWQVRNGKTKDDPPQDKTKDVEVSTCTKKSLKTNQQSPIDQREIVCDGISGRKKEAESKRSNQNKAEQLEMKEVEVHSNDEISMTAENDNDDVNDSDDDSNDEVRRVIKMVDKAVSQEYASPSDDTFNVDKRLGLAGPFLNKNCVSGKDNDDDENDIANDNENCDDLGNTDYDFARNTDSETTSTKAKDVTHQDIDLATEENVDESHKNDPESGLNFIAGSVSNTKRDKKSEDEMHPATGFHSEA